MLTPPIFLIHENSNNRVVCDRAAKDVTGASFQRRLWVEQSVHRLPRSSVDSQRRYNIVCTTRLLWLGLTSFLITFPVDHGSYKELTKQQHLDANSIANNILNFFGI